MATYAIGDIQGCYDSLMKLLDKIDYDDIRILFGLPGIW